MDLLESKELLETCQLKIQKLEEEDNVEVSNYIRSYVYNIDILLINKICRHT